MKTVLHVQLIVTKQKAAGEDNLAHQVTTPTSNACQPQTGRTVGQGTDTSSGCYELERSFHCLLMYSGRVRLQTFFFFFFNLFLAVLGLRCCMRTLQLRGVGTTPCCGEWASHCGDFSCCRARALGAWASVVVAQRLSSCGSQAPERRLSTCGAWAQLLRGTWDLPGPGLELVSPALAGGFPTIAPPRKPLQTSLIGKEQLSLATRWPLAKVGSSYQIKPKSPLNKHPDSQIMPDSNEILVYFLTKNTDISIPLNYNTHPGFPPHTNITASALGLGVMV